MPENNVLQALLPSGWTPPLLDRASDGQNQWLPLMLWLQATGSRTPASRLPAVVGTRLNPGQHSKRETEHLRAGASAAHASKTAAQAVAPREATPAVPMRCPGLTEQKDHLALQHFND